MLRPAAQDRLPMPAVEKRRSERCLGGALPRIADEARRVELQICVAVRRTRKRWLSEEGSGAWRCGVRHKAGTLLQSGSAILQSNYVRLPQTCFVSCNVLSDRLRMPHCEQRCT